MSLWQRKHKLLEYSVTNNELKPRYYHIREPGDIASLYMAQMPPRSSVWRGGLNHSSKLGKTMELLGVTDTEAE